MVLLSTAVAGTCNDPLGRVTVPVTVRSSTVTLFSVNDVAASIQFTTSLHDIDHPPALMASLISTIRDCRSVDVKSVQDVSTPILSASIFTVNVVALVSAMVSVFHVNVIHATCVSDHPPPVPIASSIASVCLSIALS